MEYKAMVSDQKIRSGVSRSPRWRGLQARMTFSYVWVTITAAFLLEVLILAFVTFGIGTAYSTVLFPQLAVQVARQYAFVAALQANGASLNSQSTFRPGETDSLLPMPDDGTSLLPKAVAATIPYTSTLVPETQPLAVGLLIAPDGDILTSSYPDRFPSQSPASTYLPNEASAITTALRNGAAASNTEMIPAGLAAWVVVPVWGKERHPIGAIYLQVPVRGPDGQLTDHPPELGKVVLLALLSALALSILVSPIGGLFGLLTTRSLVRRIRRLVAATTAFAQGHYEQRVLVARKDEIGQLEGHFNQMAEQLAESIQARQDLAEQNARLAERARISRELHDAVSQDLFSLRMLVGGIQRALPADSPLSPQIAALQGMATTMIREMRALLLELRPTQLEHLGLAEALEDLTAAYRTRLGITVNTSLRPVALTAHAEQALLRISQEALSNAARHADATIITLDLTPQERSATLTITDNGQGFEPGTDETQHGLGLRSMRERVQELGGSFALESAPGQGTRVFVSLPQEPEPDRPTGANT
ncbi:MAG TPA: sensor histidine kinase [Ktedonobacterales bacterium]|nr:sensor histidine kinase [Ktedonobacterales bacterium]